MTKSTGRAVCPISGGPHIQMKSRAKLKLVHDAEPRGPSPDFIRRSRNPDLEPPARFEPTIKGENDVVI